MSTPDERAWMASGVGGATPARLAVFCAEHPQPVPVRELVRGDGTGWMVNPGTDYHRDDPTPLDDLPPGTPVNYRLHLTLACPMCSLNVSLTEGDSRADSTVSILDSLADGGLARIDLRRLCGLVSTWR